MKRMLPVAVQLQRPGERQSLNSELGPSFSCYYGCAMDANHSCSSDFVMTEEDLIEAKAIAGNMTLEETRLVSRKKLLRCSLLGLGA